MASWRSLMKIEGSGSASGSESTPKCHGSATLAPGPPGGGLRGRYPHPRPHQPHLGRQNQVKITVFCWKILALFYFFASFWEKKKNEDNKSPGFKPNVRRRSGVVSGGRWSSVEQSKEPTALKRQYWLQIKVLLEVLRIRICMDSWFRYRIQLNPLTKRAGAGSVFRSGIVMQCTDPRIRICLKISRIRNASSGFSRGILDMKNKGIYADEKKRP